MYLMYLTFNAFRSYINYKKNIEAYCKILSKRNTIYIYFKQTVKYIDVLFITFAFFKFWQSNATIICYYQRQRYYISQAFSL